jgi:hypothetical protein
MTDSFLYILGAGASCEAVPLVNVFIHNDDGKSTGGQQPR